MLINHHVEKTEILRQLMAELSWKENAAATSARNLSAKAIWLGFDREETFALVQKYPGADYVRKNPHLFWQAWNMAEMMSDPNRYFSEPEQILLYAFN